MNAAAHIVLVENETQDVFLFQMALLRWNTPTKLTVYRNGIQAITELSKSTSRPDMLVVDWNLPEGVSGLQLLKVLRNLKHLNGCPIIVFTNSRNEKDRDAALSFGADGFLMKQVDWEANASVVQKMENWLVSEKPKKTEENPSIRPIYRFNHGRNDSVDSDQFN